MTQVRPITIFSVVYRLWAKARASQISKWAQAFIPKEVVCGLPGLSACHVWGLSIDTIEQANFTKTSALGAVFDLIKAFNTFPRKLIAKLLIHLGIPSRIVNCYMSMLKTFKRGICLAGSLSDFRSSTTGAPEGCNLAVIAMLALAFMFTSTVHSSEYDAQAVAYADNWAVMTKSLADLKGAVNLIIKMCKAFRLQLAFDKSWTWATKGNHRVALKKVDFDGYSIPVRLHEREVGADVNYCRRRSRKTTNSRFQFARERLRKLRFIPVSRKHKARLMKASAYAKALYGAEAVHIPSNQFASLRSQAVRALSLDGPGVSPFIALHLTSKESMDPQLLTIMARIKHVRSFYRVHTDRLSDFLVRLGDSHPTPGVAEGLRKALS